MGFRQCLNPLNWKDLFSCLAIPMVVRALKTANEAALSAEARGFGRKIPPAQKVKDYTAVWIYRRTHNELADCH